MGQLNTCSVCSSTEKAGSAGSESKPVDPKKAKELLLTVKSKIKAKFKSRKEAFEKLDKSRDSRIDLQEFRKFLSEELNHTEDNQIENLFNEIDEDKDGSITRAEFKKAFE